MEGIGKYTKVSLADTSWFSSVSAGQLSRQAARFGLELAQLAYDFQTEPWLMAGWTDIAIQVDQRLLTGVRQDDEGMFQSLYNAFLPRLAKGLAMVANPISEIKALTQPELPQDTGKAVTLLRQQKDGGFVVAIAFMGTGRRGQDWAGNLRLDHGDGFHEGFSHLARQFELNMENILFPSAAKALGLPSLSLQQVFEEASRQGSRFQIILAGHSQGAAVCQVFAHRCIKEGLLPGNLAGLCYASPKVSVGLGEQDCKIPLQHFLIDKDLVTRVGLSQHLGSCYILETDQAFQEAIYGKRLQDPLFQSILSLLDQVQDTAGGLLLGLAYLDVLQTRPAQTAASTLGLFIEAFFRELPSLPEDWAKSILSYSRKSMDGFYVKVQGFSPDPEAIKKDRAAVEILVQQHGAYRFTEALLSAMILSHNLVARGLGQSDMAAYSYLVVRAFDQLQPL